MSCYRPICPLSRRSGGDTSPRLYEAALRPIPLQPSAAATLRRQGRLLLTDRELKRHVVSGLHCTTFNRRPFQKTHRETMLTAADLGKQRRTLGKAHAQQAAIAVFLHVVLVHAVGCLFFLGLRTLAYQPKHLTDGVAQWPD